MNRKNLVNTLLIGVVVVMLVAFAFVVRGRAQADNVVFLRTAGMTCSSCAGIIEKGLVKQAGIAAVEVDVPGGLVAVSFDSKQARAETIAQTVTALGYGSSVIRTVTTEQYRTLTGREIATDTGSAGCACCARPKNQDPVRK